MRAIPFGVLAALFALLATSSCVSEGPGKWSESDWPHPCDDVVRVVRAVLKSERFGYDVADYKEERAGAFVSFSSRWNYGQSQFAVFSNSGMRRKIYVEIEEVYRDDDAVTRITEGPPEAPRAETSGKQPSRHVTIDGKRRLAVTRLWLSVVRERSTSVLYPGDPDKGEWREAGQDEEETEHLLNQIKLRLDEMSGRTFEMSDKARKLHEHYLRDGASGIAQPR